MRHLLLAASLALGLAAPAAAAGYSISTGAANSPWPMSLRDAQGSSSATFNGVAPAGSLFNKVQKIWSVTLPNSGYSGGYGDSVSLDENEDAYVTAGNAVFKITKSSGGVVWGSTLTGTNFTQPALTADGKVYTTVASSVIALSASDGQHLWTYSAIGSSVRNLAGGANVILNRFDGYGAPVITPQGQVIASNDSLQTCTNLNTRGIVAVASTGTLVWGIGGTNWCVATPVVSTWTGSPDNLEVYFKSAVGNSLYQALGSDGNFVRLSSEPTGSTSESTRVSVIPGAGDSEFVHVVKNGSFRGLMRVNQMGNTVWSTTQTMSTPLSSIALDGTSRMYIASYGRLFGYDSSNGDVTLNIDMDVDPGGDKLGYPTVVSSDTVMLIGQHNFQTHLYNVDTVNKTVRWRYTLSTDDFINMAQVSVSTHAIYAHTFGTSGAHKVHAFSRGTYSAVQISSTPETRSGNYMVSTVTVRAVDPSGNPVIGVPIQLSNFSVSAGVGGFTTALQTEDALSYSTTNALGQVQYRVSLDYSSWDPALNAAISSTITFQPLGLSTASISLQNIHASSYTLTISSPAIVGPVNGFMQVTTMTFLVKTSTGGLVPNHPVALKVLSVNGGPAKGGFALPGAAPGMFAQSQIIGFTDAQSQFVANYYSAVAGLVDPSYKYSPDQLPNLNISVGSYALGVAPVTYNAADTRASTFTVTYSSPAIQSDVRVTTLTVTLYDSLGSTVPAAVVTLANLTQPSVFAYSFMGAYGNAGAGPPACSVSGASGYTNALGQAEFYIDGTCTGNAHDNFGDYRSSATVLTTRVAVSTPSVFVESNFLDSYAVTVPTITSVGVSFVSTVTAVNLYGHRLPTYAEAGVTLTPLFDGTAVQGTGSLGTSVISFAGSSGQVLISSQTYNKIENIQIKATRGSGNIKTGTSGSLVIQGPSYFTITIPTGTAAGQVFSGTITAVDAGGNPVVGYGATLSLTPVMSGSTATAATGVLTPATVNLPANGKVVVNNLTYSKGDGIRIRAFDSSLNIQGYSSSITVTAPALTISHYAVAVPTQVSVGLPFTFQANALDASSAPVSYSLSRNLTVQAFLNGTAFAGSGSVGIAAMTLQSGATYSATTSQTYNKIETVQFKVTDEDGRTGLSGPVVFTGPTQFEISIPTAAQAGVQFQLVVVARDAGNNQVLGYNGTVNLAAVQAANTSLSGAGVLGVTSLNISAGLGSSSFQTYTKAEGIKIRASDSGIGVTSYSSSATVTAGPPAVMTVLANPQSTIVGVPSVLTATAYDGYSNAVAGATVTFAVINGSGVVSSSLAGGLVVSGVTSTNSVTDAFGVATAYFGSTNTLSSQANLMRATIGSLSKDTTIYNAVLITSAGGTIVNLGDPRLRVDCPANTWGFNVRMTVQQRDEMTSTDLALATAAFAGQPNTFVSTTAMRVAAVRDTNPNQNAGAGNRLVNISLPFAPVGSSVTVGSYMGQSVLVPLSVLRVFKLNQATSIFEMVLDGSNFVNTTSGVVTAEVSNPEGIFALGAPAFATLSSTSATTVTATIGAGTTAQVLVPAGAFPNGTTLSVGVPSSDSVPALPTSAGYRAIGGAISITAGGAQPSQPVTVRIGYRSSDVSGLDTDHLRLARYDASTGWQILDSQADAGNRAVYGTTDHFSLFMIVSVSPASSVNGAFVFPNPYRPSQGHTRLKFTSLPAGAKVRIFTATGRLLRELEADSVGQILTWDGTDRDGRVLASGVYLAVVDGLGGRRTIKFAVQR